MIPTTLSKNNTDILNTILRTLNTFRDEVNAKLNELTVRVDKLDTRVSNLETIVTKLDTKVNQLDDRVTKLDVKVNQLDAKVTRLDAKVNQLDDKVTKLDAKVSKLDTRVSNLESTNHDIFAEIVLIHNRISMLEDHTKDIPDMIKNIRNLEKKQQINDEEHTYFGQQIIRNLNRIKSLENKK